MMRARRGVAGLAALAGMSAAFFGGRASRPVPAMAGAGHAAARRVLYWVDPMHPRYRADRPGMAPDCGMDLVPVYLDMRPGSVVLTREQEEAIHLETEKLRRSAGTRRVRTVGMVAADERLTYEVAAGADGWVRRVFDGGTGAEATAGQVLAEFYSRDASAPQQAYVFALEALEHAQKEDQRQLARDQLVTARDNLQFLGMGEAQIEALGRARREFANVQLAAPAAGRIVERDAAVGKRVMKGEVLYRIADLSRVWVLADQYAGEADLRGRITSAEVQVAGWPVMAALVTRAQADSRKLRLEVANAGGRLLPGTPVEVRLAVAASETMTLAVDAVLDSGMRKHVFVATGGGGYEAREVETGRLEDGRVEITRGLEEGERVVTRAAFLLDSESRLRN